MGLRFCVKICSMPSPEMVTGSYKDMSQILQNYYDGKVDNCNYYFLDQMETR